MTHQYRVHRVSWHDREQDVQLASGEQVRGSVKSLEVEMVPADHDGGTMLLRYVGAAAEEMAAGLKQDDVVTVTVAKAVE